MDYGSFFDNLGSGLNVAGQIQNAGNAGTTNQNVQQNLGQAQGTLQEQIAALQASLGGGRQVTQDAYNQAQGLYGQQNQQLQGNIDTMTTNLNSLSDPNSAYMQQARTAMERKDAAAGRRSQWGEREVQLQALLADYMGKYSPGLNNSITGARNQMQTNTSSLADLYARMNSANTAQQQALTQATQQQMQLAQAQNTTGRQANNSQTFNTNQALQAALGLGKSLFSTFGTTGSTGEGYNGQDYNNFGAQSYSPWVSTYGGMGDSGYNASLNNNSYMAGSGSLFGDYGGSGGGLFGNDLWGE